MEKPYRVGLAWQMDRRYGEEAIRGIAEYSKRYGPWLFFLNQVEAFDSRRFDKEPVVDGIIVGHDTLQFRADIHWSSRVPSVSVHMVPPRVTRWNISPDNVVVGQMAAAELLRLGLRHFAFCPEAPLDSPLVGADPTRFAGFAQRLREQGHEVIVYDGPLAPWDRLRPRAHFAPMSAWLSSLPKPIGIFAGSDSRARHVLASAEAAGVRVPEDVALIGVNNEAWAELLFRGLSSIELDGFGAGYAAAGLLHRLMEGEAVSPGITLIAPRRLVVRRSSSRVIIDDPDVAAAVTFITENATSGIDVDDVVESVPLSRRSLERRFRQCLGHSILREIHVARVERAKLLLMDLSVSLARVAEVAGFGSPKRLRLIFLAITGTTPARYREQLRAAGT